ncbi:hypothetical protein [Nocardia sp. R7R-8]|uniref:hypothetical protein n=1 Tax=Nocardia sp. R7R-8 TaxID=3459304 RepID=UPI00403E2007
MSTPQPSAIAPAWTWFWAKRICQAICSPGVGPGAVDGGLQVGSGLTVVAEPHERQASQSTELELDVKETNLIALAEDGALPRAKIKTRSPAMSFTNRSPSCTPSRPGTQPWSAAMGQRWLEAY